MKIAVPKEVKNHEYRVGLVPSSVAMLTRNGHEVYIETQAGVGVGYSDSDYEKVGAKILPKAADIFSTGELIVKVKEPQPDECKMLRENQILFTYLHLAADLIQTELLKESGCIAIAYETVTNPFGQLPLLTPMSEVAGRLSIQAAAHSLEKSQGGSGVLLGGVPGVNPAKVTVIGGGIVGVNALQIALGMRADVVVIDRDTRRLQKLDSKYGPHLKTLYSNEHHVAEAVINSDVVIGAVLIPGAAAPKLVTCDMLKQMRPGSVVVDVAIDQGGCFETSRPTTHDNPTYVEENIVHYCVTNMPGAVARTSVQALNNVTLPYVLKIASMGYKEALFSDTGFMNGLNIFRGKVTNQAVADSLNMEYVYPQHALGSAQ